MLVGWDALDHDFIERHTTGFEDWAREIKKLGHDTRLMPPTYVKAYVKRGKNDAADAEAGWSV